MIFFGFFPFVLGVPFSKICSDDINPLLTIYCNEISLFFILLPLMNLFGFTIA